MINSSVHPGAWRHCLHSAASRRTQPSLSIYHTLRNLLLQMTSCTIDTDWTSTCNAAKISFHIFSTLLVNMIQSPWIARFVVTVAPVRIEPQHQAAFVLSSSPVNDASFSQFKIYWPALGLRKHDGTLSWHLHPHFIPPPSLPLSALSSFPSLESYL